MGIAYDVENVMDDLILKQAAQERKRGFLRRFVLFITRFIHQYQLHGELESIKVQLSKLALCAYVPILHAHDIDIEEID